MICMYMGILSMLISRENVAVYVWLIHWFRDLVYLLLANDRNNYIYQVYDLVKTFQWTIKEVLVT